MDFGGAINAVKAGHRVQRSAWSTSEPGKHIRLQGVDHVVIVRDLLAPALAGEAEVASDGTVASTYLAGPDDMLAEDWSYVRLPDTGDARAGDPLAQRTYQSQGPTIPQESIENDNVLFVDTASVGPVPVAPARPVGDRKVYLSKSGTHVVVDTRLEDRTDQHHIPIADWSGEPSIETLRREAEAA